MPTFTATGDNAAPQQAPLRQHGHRLKAALGALVFPLQRARWHPFIAGTPGLAALAQAHPSLLYKIYRPYANRQLACAAWVDLLCGHYRMPELELLASKKRAEARRRGAMQVQLAADMRWQLSALLKLPVAAPASQQLPLCAGVS